MLCDLKQGTSLLCVQMPELSNQEDGNSYFQGLVEVTQDNACEALKAFGQHCVALVTLKVVF